LKNRKGIILAGGKGTRLFPVSKVISKQLLPVYDKPMIYYPISTLMSASIREILVICNPCDIEIYKNLLGDGSDLGISISYETQKEPEGIAQAFLIAEKFIGNSNCVLILGDNLFYGNNLCQELISASGDEMNATIFAYPVVDPERYGVVQFDKNFKVKNIQEKPKLALSNYAITGIYFYDNNVIKVAKTLKPSPRGELEITDINNYYLKRNLLKVRVLNRGIAWFDTGTFDSLIEASNFIQTLEHRQGLKIGCPEEIAWRNRWISITDLKKIAKKYINSSYGKYLIKLEESEL